MKKLCTLLSLLLVFTLLLSPVAQADAGNTDTLASWDIRITVPAGKTAVLKGSEYYIYAQKDGYIPYVMLTTSGIDNEEDFIEAFSSYMRGVYEDLQISAGPTQKTVGDKRCHEIDYSYTVSGYAVTDRRLVLSTGGRTYVFASKEIPSLGMTVDGMLEQVVADAVFLNAAATITEDNSANAYLYCLEDGTPKYVLDLTGEYADNPVLHCYFISGDPIYYKSRFILDLATADIGESSIAFHKVTDQYGLDHSDWFKTLLIRFSGDTLTMDVERDASTLAGGSGDNILTGSYLLQPVRQKTLYVHAREDGQRKYWLDLNGDAILLHALFRSGEPEYREEVFTFDPESMQLSDHDELVIGKVFDAQGHDVSDWFDSLLLYEIEGGIVMEVKRDESTLAGGAEDNILTGSYSFERKSYLTPACGGPYTPKELGRWAQIYYFEEHGFFPPRADVEEREDGSFSIHLYEVVEQDGLPAHTASSAWYTVDAEGVGTDDILGSPVCLFG